MRIRAIAAIVVLLVPAALSAQRIPLPIGRRPPRGEPLPPTAGPIAKEQAYRRWRLSVESYPMVSYYQTSAFGSWTELGMGTRADYLINRHMSATLDMTSSLIGSPSVVNTAEVGTRLHPEWAERAGSIRTWTSASPTSRCSTRSSERSTTTSPTRWRRAPTARRTATDTARSQAAARYSLTPLVVADDGSLDRLGVDAISRAIEFRRTMGPTT